MRWSLTRAPVRGVARLGLTEVMVDARQKTVDRLDGQRADLHEILDGGAGIRDSVGGTPLGIETDESYLRDSKRSGDRHVGHRRRV
ncbi:hypothetical protein OIU91_04720 [Streptomyces sp. NBC_01456]|uniref:hypothetical protein n=1 Tax=unclassified Streptomyces TaxID=2593676 RepID=UPI002E37A499|nr:MULTISPECIES: hypothetical protein [unclassified Streptomyces]